MHSIPALPVIPMSSLAGLPPAADLPTLITRRRYAFTLAAAFVEEPSYDLEVWPHKDMPLFLQLRAMQEDWPMIGSPRTTTVMRPLPLPEDPTELFDRAAAAVPEEHRATVRRVLEVLWQGDHPGDLPASVHACFVKTIFIAGRKAADEASNAARAADPPRPKRKKIVARV